MKKIGKFNLISKRICKLNCNCGWSLHIGGDNIKDLKKLEKYLKNVKIRRSRKGVQNFFERLFYWFR